jgi:hypothetical protein
LLGVAHAAAIGARTAGVKAGVHRPPRRARRRAAARPG